MFHLPSPSLVLPRGGSAVLGDGPVPFDAIYRYALTRRWGTGTRGLFVVALNPSKADATIDDATVRKITGFAKLWGFDWFALGNLAALRATDPADLHATIALMGLEHAIGPENDRHLIQMIRACSRILLAWGTNGEHPALQERVRDVVRQVVYEVVKQTDSRDAAGGDGLVTEVGCLGHNKGGSPKHPLMVGYAQPFVPISIDDLKGWAA